MVVSAFSVLDRNYAIWANLVKKNQNCQFKLKFGTDSNMQNSMVMLTFSVLDLFGQIWSKNLKLFVQK